MFITALAGLFLIGGMGAAAGDVDRALIPVARAAPANATTSSSAMLTAADRASFKRLASSLGGRSGVAVSPLGLDERVQAAGSLRSVVAWSTAKVPVAMAVIAAGQGDSHQADLRQAITASDNAAVERLWTSLGDAQTAAGKATGQLRAAAVSGISEHLHCS